MKELLSDLNKTELSARLGLPAYKARQIFKWLSKGCGFSEMSDQQKSFREFLDANFFAQGVTVEKRLVSKDGTEKYLFRLNDGNVVEGVLMKYKYGHTLCVSTQVGCRMGCVFCASTLNGLVRNLTAGEMLSEVASVNKLVSGGKTGQERGITNVVLMGCGEPLDNYENVTAFFRLLNDADGLNISLRNVSVSTCGIVPNILRLADDELPVNLTVSLHSPFQYKRVKLMPVSKAYPLSGVIEAAKYYFKKTGRRVYFEYTLIEGTNDTEQDAEEIARLLKGLPAHVNLILLNPVKERRMKGSDRLAAEKFAAELEKKGVSVSVRRQMGSDIEGACGQLRNKFVRQENHVSSGKKDE